MVNLSRTVQLAQTLGIPSVWTTPESVQWVQTALGGSGYASIVNAPWYDPGVPASAEFAGLVPLAFPGLDDSTREASTIEYITDGGNSSKPRNKTLSIVASAVLVASSDRGADFGRRWLDRMLAGGASQTFCSGSELRYFQYEPSEGASNPPQVHRRDVTTTKAVSVTKKWRGDCSSLWTIQFTWTANDPFEYGEPIQQFYGLGSDLPTTLKNLNANPAPTSLTGYTGGNAAISLASGYLRVTANTGNTDSYAGVSTGGLLNFGMVGGKTYTVSAESGGFVAGTGPATGTARRVVIFYRTGAGAYTQVVSPAVTGSGQRVSVTFTPPGGTTEILVRFYFGYSTSGYQEWRNITVTEGTVAAVPAGTSRGNLTMTEVSCPEYDYSPIYDPLYPALVPPPSVPNFYPDGWDIADGDSFKRYWIRLAAVEPSALALVPDVTFTSDVDARMVRFTVWPSAAATSATCGWLWSIILTYEPASQQFVVDGEQQASYVWDGVSPLVRRSDSLVYAPGAVPVDWLAFNDPAGLLVSVDTFAKAGGGYEGDGTLKAALALIPKSD